MSAATIPTHGVMEGGGSYNLHAKIPAGEAILHCPIWRRRLGPARSGQVQSSSRTTVLHKEKTLWLPCGRPPDACVRVLAPSDP